MRPTRALASIVAGLLLALLATPALAATLTLEGSSQKICQLTGQTDWATGQTTDAQTFTRYGLSGVDLGFPIEGDKGVLYFLFGDAIPSGHNPPVNTIPPDDAIGVTMRTAAPDATTCLDLNYLSAAPQTLLHPTVTPAIQQGTFNVPTGGVMVDHKIYAFFWTDHCPLPDPVLPNAAAPLTLPPADTPPTVLPCLETGTSNSLGFSVLAYSTPDQPTAFTQTEPWSPTHFVPQMPNGFDYVSAAKPPPRYVKNKADGSLIARPALLIPVFGVARHRASIPYLAMAPRQTFGDFTTWKYFAGLDGYKPIWVTYQQWQSGQANGQWTPPPLAQLYVNIANPNSPTGDEQCVGEHSVTWNAPLRIWLMTYTCGGAQVEARWALKPWGPWSSPIILLSAVQNPALYCTLFWNKANLPPPNPPPPATCPSPLVSQQIPLLSFGYFYAPFVMARFTKAEPPVGDPKAKAATLYWLLSTWDPYQVTVMRSKIQFAP